MQRCVDKRSSRSRRSQRTSFMWRTTATVSVAVLVAVVFLPATTVTAFMPLQPRSTTLRTVTMMGTPLFYNDFEGYNNNEESSASSSSSQNNDEDDEDDDDEEPSIDPDSLGDWRTFRRNLATLDDDEEDDDDDTADHVPKKATKKNTILKSTENERLLATQNAELAQEYKTDVWAHTTATPEVGGLVVRLPLEVELTRNTKHTLTGRKLQSMLLQEIKEMNERKKGDGSIRLMPTFAIWNKAQQLVEEGMHEIAQQADRTDGNIDPQTLKPHSAELLQLYLDHQEHWQEVCLVLNHGSSSAAGGGAETSKPSATTLVLNRPMTLKLTDNLARMVLFGAFQTGTKKKVATFPMERPVDVDVFLTAFGPECAVYVGGPDEQGLPAIMLHGLPDLPGAVEIAPGAKIYQGGIQAAMEGVLTGLYRPLDFRFFVGRHIYEDGSDLERAVLLGKLQPVACARSLVLKQCISLPKPLWHEALELCGSDMRTYSQLELAKRDETRYQIIDDGDEDDEEDYLQDLDLDELEALDEEDDDFLAE